MANTEQNNKKLIYYFNGYPAYKNFYLKSDELNYSKFIKIVDQIIWVKEHQNKPKWLTDIAPYILPTLAVELFFTPNIVGDHMELVARFNIPGLHYGHCDLYYCPNYEYYELLGLSQEEQDILRDYLDNTPKEDVMSYLKENKIGRIS